jgi:hypothetical protein
MVRLGVRVRRLVAVALAGTLVVLGVQLVAAAPANATPPNCVLAAGHYETAGSYITAYRFWSCDNGNEVPLSVTIDQYQSPGVWSEVASGWGETTYYCSGLAFNRYRSTNSSAFDIRCG